MRARISKPGVTDLEWMLATCSPNDWDVQFFEEEADARAALKAWLDKGRSGYVGRITLQGEFR